MSQQQLRHPAAHGRPKGNAAKGCAFLGCGGLAAVAILAVMLTSHGGGGSPPAAASPAVTHAVAKAAPCKLKTTFDYIERVDDPGASVMADEIGNVDLANCTDSLSDFAATAGQAPGECTTIALASKNPHYDAGKIPAPRLKHVIASAGPGC